MLFTSANYFIFLAIVFFVYCLLARKRVPVWFLLASSYYFYAFWNPKFLGLVPRSAFTGVSAPQTGANTFEVKTQSGNVRLFGAVLENDGTGVVYDSLGVNGAYASLLKTVMNEQQQTLEV